MIEVIDMKKNYLLLTTLLSAVLLASCAPTTPAKETTYLELWSHMTEYDGGGHKASDATQTFNDKNQVIKRETNYYDRTDPDIINEKGVIDYTYNDRGDVETITTVITYINSNDSTITTVDTYSYNYYDNGTIKDITILTGFDDLKISYYAEYDNLGRMTYELNRRDGYRYEGKYTYKEQFTNFISATITYATMLTNDKGLQPETLTIDNSLNDKGYITNQTMYSSTGSTTKTTYTLDKYNCAIKTETYTTAKSEDVSYLSYFYSENTYYKNNPDKLDKSIFFEYESQDLGSGSFNRTNLGLISFEYDEYGRTIQTLATDSSARKNKYVNPINGITNYEYDREIPAK